MEIGVSQDGSDLRLPAWHLHSDRRCFSAVYPLGKPALGLQARVGPRLAAGSHLDLYLPYPGLLSHFRRAFGAASNSLNMAPKLHRCLEAGGSVRPSVGASVPPHPVLGQTCFHPPVSSFRYQFVGFPRL